MLAWPTGAGAAGELTAVATRVADHPAYVRVVVDFRDGTLGRNEVRTTDPHPFDGTVRVRVDHQGVQAQAPRRAALGLRVRVVQGTDRVGVRVRAVPRRFKHVSYAVVGGDRLAIDLWKSRPPVAAAEVRVGPSRCLTLGGLARKRGAVRGFGRERNLFEHALVGVVRARSGSVLARKPVTAARGRWGARLRYRVARRQAGTFEAFARSARDGSLDCLVQRRVVLAGRLRSAPTATRVRFGNHPGYVRAVVDFAGDQISEHQVMATDPRPFDSLARLSVGHAGIGTRVAVARGGEGVRVRTSALPRQGRLRIGIRAMPRRFKYVSYAVIGGDRLAIDLWKSRPPSSAAEISRGRGGCLTLDAPSIAAGRVMLEGRERNLFEHGLNAIVRGPGGSVLGQRPVTAAAGRWRATVGYNASRRVAGTVEAVAASAMDGSLDCLVQRRVVLPAAP